MSSRDIDDQYKRLNKYRIERFDGKKSMKDDYTGKRVFIDSSKHTQQTSAQVDHIVPLYVVQQKFSDLTQEQQKAIANNDANYAITSAKLNRNEKNKLQNHEYVMKKTSGVTASVVEQIQDRDISGALEESKDFLTTSSNMLKKEVVATTVINAEATKYRTVNMVQSEHGGRELAYDANTRAVIYHGRQLFSGQEDFSEASIGTVTDIISSKVELSIKQEIDYQIKQGVVKVSDGASIILSNSSNGEAAKMMKSLINEKNLGVISAAVSKIGKLFVRYLAEGFDTGILVYDMCKTACDIGFAMIGGEVLGEAGTLIGALIGGPIGAGVGRFIGEFVGALVGSEIMNVILSFETEGDIFLKMQTELAMEIERHTYSLVQELSDLHREHEQSLQSAFQDMFLGIMDGKMVMVNAGLDALCKEFGFEVEFDNQDDFDDFMLDSKRSARFSRATS